MEDKMETEGTIVSIYDKVTKAGKDYYSIRLTDGLTYTHFALRRKEITEGANVSLSFVMNGDYRNVETIKLLAEGVEPKVKPASHNFGQYRNKMISDNARKQVLIVRQNVLGHAVEIAKVAKLGNAPVIETVKVLAEDLEKWVHRE